MSRDNFIEQAKQIYGNKYDYKNVPNIELYPFNNIPIFCPKHGLFSQSVYDHLLGKGCFECYKDNWENEILANKP